MLLHQQNANAKLVNKLQEIIFDLSFKALLHDNALYKSFALALILCFGQS